ncbi:HSP70/90 family co-chaperone [Saccharomycopsis crataegensis]|uniref:HSP70/90 family co-chaperone n=1 Tax=Saccharomycopsis crataegensis TaxID=43959 RepID=A0AAV5QM30_9ASCO|nr:HSP70/90 family co-chaperone [Saccharomycopsis crataegensis]
MPAPMLPGQSASKKSSGKLDPQLPPQLQQDKSKDMDALVAELNKTPFFMTKYDDQDGDNEALEALKALAYEGEPDEVATNFRNQGNEHYREKSYHNAIEFYTKGIDVKCGIKDIDSKLYLNRAQCNLVLKNYRKCINDCQKALQLDPALVKAYFRMAKAFLKIQKYQEAHDAVEFGLKLSPEDKEMKLILKQADDKINEAREREEKNEKEYKTFLEAMKVRGMSLVFTKDSGDNYKKFRLEDKFDIESQFIFDGIIEFPSLEYNCYIDKVGELSSIVEMLSIPYMSAPENFANHPELSIKNVQVYMETISGGLIKAGKKKTINELITLQTPQIPIIDWIVRLYVVSKDGADEFIKRWNKKERLDNRRSSNEINLRTGELVDRDN